MVQFYSTKKIYGRFYKIPPTPSSEIKPQLLFPNLPSCTSYVYDTTHLPVGFTELPPALSSTANNVADIVNEYLEHDCKNIPAHPIEKSFSMPVPVVS